MGRRIDEFLGSPRRHPSSECSEVRERVEELAKALEELRVLVEEAFRQCMSRLDSLEAEIKSSKRFSRASQRRGVLRGVLRDQKFIMASEARSKLGMSPYRLRSEAAAEGLTIVEAGGDFAVMTRESLEEFKAMLSSLATPDPAEASRELGEYGRLFQALREGGQVYYDARRRRWVMLEE